MRDETREEILKEVEERIKTMVKELLEALMKEEREIYLENHPTKANGYLHLGPPHPRRPFGEPQSSPRTGRRFPSPDPSLPKAGLAGTFRGHPRSLCSVITRKISAFLEGVYGAFYSPQGISCLIEVTSV